MAFQGLFKKKGKSTKNSKYCKIFKVCLTILGHYALKDLKTSTFLKSRSPSYSSKSIHQMKISPNQYYDD